MRQGAPRPKRPSGRPAPKVRPAREGAIQVELISIGRELLRGRVQEENGRNIARHLTQRGARIRRITVVDDTEHSISTALREALGRDPHLVITTGGLGPTDNDRTAVAIGEVLGLTVGVHSEAKAMVRASYQRLIDKGVIPPSGMTAVREKICTLPVGTQPIANPIGVSPGILLRLPGGSAVLALPGKPDEAGAVLEAALAELGGPLLDRPVARREIESPTADESALRPLLDRLHSEFPGLWIETHPSGSRRRGSRIAITLEASDTSAEAAEEAADTALARLLALAAGTP